MNIKNIVKTLNEAYKLDPKLMETLMKYSCKCNDELADHPTIQVSQDNKISFIGLLNGLVGRDHEMICTVWNDDETELLGFDIVDPVYDV